MRRPAHGGQAISIIWGTTAPLPTRQHQRLGPGLRDDFRLRICAGASPLACPIRPHEAVANDVDISKTFACSISSPLYCLSLRAVGLRWRFI
jgi:hypothetical protein